MASSQRDLFAFVQKSLLELRLSLEAIMDDAAAAEDWVDRFASVLVSCMHFWSLIVGFIGTFSGHGHHCQQGHLCSHG